MAMISKSSRWLLFILLALLTILACNGSSELLDRNQSVLPADLEVDREKAIYLSGGQPRSLDPALSHSGAYGPLGAIFSGLVTLDTNLQVQPDLASGWDISEDGTVYTFHLRPDARFHDGRSVTAQDVVASWERALSPELESDTASTYLGDIQGVAEYTSGEAQHISGLKVIDNKTLEVTIDQPKAYFLAKLSYPAAFVIDAANVTQPDWEYRPNGTGAFRLQEWKDDEYLILRRSDIYYGQGPAVDHIVYLMGAGIPLSMYEKGDIDMVGIGGGNLERAQDPNDPLHQDLRIGVDMCTSYVGFDNSEAPFDDPLVRRAFTQAIDKERLVEGLFMGDALQARGPLPPGMPGYGGDLPDYPYDPQQAQELLAQAGYADPAAFPVVTFKTSGYGSVGPYVTALISMWQEALGVTIEPVMVDPYLYLDELYSGDTGDIFVSGWCADYPDPENFLDLLFHSDSQQNLVGYSSPQVDDLLERARIETDVPNRMAQYAEIEKIIVEEAPSAFLVHSLSAELVKPHIKNYHWTPIGVAQWHKVEITP